MKILIPTNSLVVIIGISGSGKSTFAKQHFATTQIVSSDFCRALICDDENNQEVNQDAFELLHLLISKRLALHKLTVVDATNIKPASRQIILALAQAQEIPTIAIVLNFELGFCLKQNGARSHRVVPSDIIAEQFQELQSSLPNLMNEGFQSVYVLAAPKEFDDLIIQSGETMNSIES